MNTNSQNVASGSSGLSWKTISGLVILSLLLAACDQQQASSSADKYSSERVRPKIDFAGAVNGGRLYQENCAQCHGTGAEGAPQWKQPGAEGKYPAPPLNGTGHAWHHPKKGLVRTIKYGTLSMGGSMPAWQSRLSDKEIDDIIDWFQSYWSDEIYREWQKRDRG